MAVVKLSGVQQPLAIEFCSTLLGLHCFKRRLRCVAQMAAEKYPYFLGQEPTLLIDVEFLLQSKDVAAILRIMRWATSYDIHTEYSIEVLGASNWRSKSYKANVM
ncbi:hypothetical protein BUALT_Bualt08G0004000 [Buddleja alternifolia]|uniref:Uncharacterized protein n=1 Tax=Buddleja alternifolia TaxID=168488 RepID=A0AAV6X9W8_9LAMI|nr:hypothetical protein BUALT_Bualt08G0004000 [Buddleja alternifolia]